MAIEGLRQREHFPLHYFIHSLSFSFHIPHATLTFSPDIRSSIVSTLKCSPGWPKIGVHSQTQHKCISIFPRMEPMLPAANFIFFHPLWSSPQSAANHIPAYVIVRGFSVLHTPLLLPTSSHVVDFSCWPPYTTFWCQTRICYKMYGSSWI